MNNDKSYNMTFQRIFDGNSYFSLIVLCAVSVPLFFAALEYKSLNWVIVCAFITVFIITKGFFLDLTAVQREVVEGCWLGAMKAITGAALLWSVFMSPFNANLHDLEKAFWMFIVILFLEAGIKNIAHAIFIHRKRTKELVQVVEAEKDRIKLEEAMATRWAEAEAERKRKAAIEDDLLSDLNSYLSEM